MEEEYTEDESEDHSVHSGNLTDEDESGEEDSHKLLGDDPTGTSDEEKQARPPRRSKRQSKRFMASPVSEDVLTNETDVEEQDLDQFDDQAEWKPDNYQAKKLGERRRRKRRAPVVGDRRKRERNRECRQKLLSVPVHVLTTTSSTPIRFPPKRTRGRPRKEPIHWEGGFDVFDEDKASENSASPASDGRKARKRKTLDKIPEVIEDVEHMQESSETASRFDEEEAELPIRKRYPRSVAMYGLEEEEEESDDDDARTISMEPAEYAENTEAINFDPEELLIEQRNFNDPGVQVLFDYHSAYQLDEDDDNTQYSVEAELAKYAREDAEMELRNAQEAVEMGFAYGNDEEDPAIQLELEQFANVDENDLEYFVVEENGEQVYYAVPKGFNPEEFERPVHPIEFDGENGFEDGQFVDEQGNYIYDEEQFQECQMESCPDDPFDSQNMELQVDNENIAEVEQTADFIDEDNQMECEYFDESIQNVEIYEGEVPEDFVDEQLEQETEENYEEFVERNPSPIGSDVSVIELTMGSMLISGEVVEVPDIMLENEGVFRQILCPETFASLSDENKEHLKRFLPRGLDENDLNDCVTSALSHDPSHYFGSPLSKAFNKIRAGYFNVDRATDLHQLQDNRRVLYDHFIRRHYMKLLKRLVMARHAILEQAAHLPDHVPIKVNPKDFINTKKWEAEETVRQRAKMRAKLLINYAAEKNLEESLSSDDSDPEIPVPPIRPVADAESSSFNPEFVGSDLDMYQPHRMRTIKEMLKAHKVLKKKHPDCPNLDFEDLTLEEVFERSGLSFQSERNFLQMSANPELPIKRRRKRRKKAEILLERERNRAAAEAAFQETQMFVAIEGQTGLANES